MPKQKFTPRRVTSEADRNKGRGSFITLKKTNDQFLGYALFSADPERDDNPGYYEYFEHYTPATGYCPCAGDDCPLCAEGDNPSTRAKSVWLVVDNEDDDPSEGSVKIFNLNWGMVQEFSEDKDSSLGTLYRVKRLEGKGVYSIRPKTGKLTKTQLKAAMKEIEDDQLEKQAQRQMNRVFEEMDVEAALQDDDEDTKSEPDEKPKSRKGTAKTEVPDDDDENDDTNEDEDDEKPAEKKKPAEFDPDESDEFSGTVTVKKVSKDNTAMVVTEDGIEFKLYGTDQVTLSDFSKDDVITVEASKDEDGDFVADLAEPDEAPQVDPAELPDEIDNEVVTVTKVNGSPEDTLEVEMEDGTKFELFFLGEGEDANGKDWGDLDLDDYEVGQQITISAAKDSDGDMLASVYPESVKSGKSGKKKTKA
jgi:hypothetical protein